jgi:glycosyltransferase involved in cell wall biosynthesis
VISIILLTKNEEDRVGEYWGWLKEVKTINEIVVVDDNSTDKTLAKLKSVVPKNINLVIIKNTLTSFSEQRKLALSKTKNKWVLWLDADETPSPQLLKFLKNFKPSKYDYAFSFPRWDYFLGQRLCHGENTSQSFTRLFLKTYGSFQGVVHETWLPARSPSFLNLPILHYPHRNFYHFINKINFYSTLRAQQLYSDKISTNLFQIIFYPLAKFVQNYIIRLGFLDSTPGIIMALTMSFHSFLVRSKLWHMYQPSSTA